jgi:hypothetical protein
MKNTIIILPLYNECCQYLHKICKSGKKQRDISLELKISEASISRFMHNNIYSFKLIENLRNYVYENDELLDCSCIEIRNIFDRYYPLVKLGNSKQNTLIDTSDKNSSGGGGDDSNHHNDKNTLTDNSDRNTLTVSSDINTLSNDKQKSTLTISSDNDDGKIIPDKTISTLNESITHSLISSKQMKNFIEKDSLVKELYYIIEYFNSSLHHHHHHHNLDTIPSSIDYQNNLRVSNITKNLLYEKLYLLLKEDFNNNNNNNNNNK